MTSALHLLSANRDPSVWDMIEILKNRGGEEKHSICCLDPWTSEILQRCRRLSSRTVIQRPWPLSNLSRSLARLSDSLGVGVMHAWDVRSASLAAAQAPKTPLVLTILDPSLCKNAARWVRSFPRRIAVIAANQVIRQRLLSAGMDGERVVVIRGPVDFRAINDARSSDLRKSLLNDAGPAILLHGPASRDGGQFQGIWAAAIVRQMYPDLRVIVPYSSRETLRLRRFVRSIGFEDILASAPESLTWPQLAACVDVFVAPALDDISTEPLAAAMAAGTVIVGTAIRSITELVADRSNGLLVRRNDPTALAAKILTAIEDVELRRRVADTARAQAYEVFGVRAFVDHYQRLYENLLEDRPPGDGIVDTAMAA